MKIKLLIMAVLFISARGIYADSLVMEPVTICAGETKQVSINLSNSDKKNVAFQFDLILPEGITIAKDSKNMSIASLDTKRTNNHTLCVSEKEKNTYRFLAFSMTNAEFYGTSETLINITLQADEDIGIGNKSAKIVSQVFVDTEGNLYKWDDVSFNMQIKERPIYTLEYMVDGVLYKNFSIREGDVITAEPTPTREGHTFSGWSEIPETMPAHDVTVIGTFTVNKYKMTYRVDGEEYMTSEVEYGSAITAEAEPTEEGYTFSGWSEIPETMPAHDVTVTGTFIVNKYTITYMIDDEVYQTESVGYASTITPPSAPEREGYTFEWIEVPETMPAHDITIVGSYTSGINTINVDDEDVKWYTIDGKRIETLRKGMNIMKKSGSKTKKVVVK